MRIVAWNSAIWRRNC